LGCVDEEGTIRAVQQLIDDRLEGGQLGGEVGFQGVNEGIVRIQMRCEMFDGDMGLIDGILEILVASGGHLERGSAGKEKNGWVGSQKKYLEVIGTAMISSCKEI
jgi:hypothetical protein